MMEMTIVLLLLLASVVFYIVRPDNNSASEANVSSTPPAPPSAPSAPEFQTAELEVMTKAELMDLASAKEVHAAKSWNKSRIISALTAED